MLPFEMRTVLYGICLFNDVRHKHRSNIYMKQKEGEQEQDAGETDRESVCERGRVAARRGRIGCKNDHWRKWTIWDKNRIRTEGLF